MLAQLSEEFGEDNLAALDILLTQRIDRLADSRDEMQAALQKLQDNETEAKTSGYENAKKYALEMAAQYKAQSDEALKNAERIKTAAQEFESNSNSGIKTGAESAEEMSKKIKARWQEIADYTEIGLYTEEQALAERIKFVQTYFPKYNAESHKYYKQIFDDQEKIAEESTEKQQNIVADGMAKLVNEYDDAMSKIEDRRKKYKERLLAIGGDLFDVTTEKDKDGNEVTTYTVNDIDEQIKKMREYHNDIKKLKEDGASYGLLDELNSLGADEAMAGCTNYNAQYTATVEETSVKRIIISNANAAYFAVGMPVSIGTGTDKNAWACHNKAESAAITAIEAYDDNNKAIYVDVDNAFDTTTSTYITTFHWRSGYSDNVLGRDGCPCPTSAGLTNGKYPVVIQGIECFVGQYEVGSNAVIDIVDSTGKRDVYITNDSTKLTTDINTIKSTYTKIAEQIVPTSVENWNYITAVGCNVESGIIVPTAAGQSGSSSATGYADGLYCDSASSGQRECLCFGSLWNGALSGVSCLSAGYSLGPSYWDIGARLSVNG